MTKIAQMPDTVSDVIRQEALREHAYERAEKSLTVAEFSDVAPHGVEIGEIYADDGTILVQADVAGLATDGTTPLSILIDDAVYFDGHADGVTEDYVCVVGGAGASGSAIVKRKYLKFGDTLSSGEIDTVVSVLESQGIRVV